MSPGLSEQWSKLPSYLGDHIVLCGLALSVGVFVSLPLGVLVSKAPRLRWPVLATAGVIQTVPSLALLALMVPLLGAFGFWPALLALTLYSALPILRNTVVGITNLDPGVLEAARGVGMTPWQSLVRVELPLALPVIVAGVRTATVWVVGIATLSTPVGQPSLGNFIFGGLQTRNWTSVLFGCVAAAVLAIVLDLLLAALERGAKSRNRLTIGAALLGILGVFGGGALAPRWPMLAGAAEAAPIEPATGGQPTLLAEQPASESADSEAPKRPLRIGSKTFTEQYILAELLAQRLRAVGFDVERAESLGSTVAFDALRTDAIDVYVDYTGTIWANYMKRNEPESRWQVRARTAAWLAKEHGVRQLGALGFENAYALAMRTDRAASLGIRTIADLAPHAEQLRLGSDYEFFERPEWTRLRATYSLQFSELVSYDSTFMYSAVQQGEVDVITAFSSDGRIAAFELRVLEDPKQAFPPYEAVVLLAPGIAGDERVERALSPLLDRIDVDTMRRTNLLVDRDQSKLTPAAAADWLGEYLEVHGD